MSGAVPVAVTEKEAVWPAVIVRGEIGWAVMVGSVPKVRVTTLLVMEPAVLVTTQRNWSPDMASEVAILSDAVVAPV